MGIGSAAAVTGLIGNSDAVGEVGRRVAERVARGGVPQRLVVTKGLGPSDLPGADVAVITDSGDAEYMRQAMKGVQTLLLVPVREDAERTEKHMSVVDVAVAAGVRRIVYPSFPGAAPDATFTLACDHGAPDWQSRRG